MLDAERLRQARERISPDPQLGTYGVRSRVAGQSSDTFAEYSLNPIYDSPMTKEDIAAVGGALAARRYIVWQVWLEIMEQATVIGSATLPMPEPKVDDRIVDESGRTWIVQKVTRKMMGEVFNLLCKRA